MVKELVLSAVVLVDKKPTSDMKVAKIVAHPAAQDGSLQRVIDNLEERWHLKFGHLPNAVKGAYIGKGTTGVLRPLDAFTGNTIV